MKLVPYCIKNYMAFGIHYWFKSEWAGSTIVLSFYKWSLDIRFDGSKKKEKFLDKP